MTYTKIAEKLPKFYCEKCDFKCIDQWVWNKHITTSKHKNTYHTYTKDLPEKKNRCLCGKEYMHRQSLYNHKKKCYVNLNSNDINIEMEEDNDEFTNNKLLSNDFQSDKEIFMYLLNQNKQLQDQIVELCKEKNQVISNNTIHNNNNSNNQTFNLQFFLNETCKDAMNIMEFVDSMKIELTDLENIAQVGYVKGMSNLILKNLKALDVTMRPVHCSDSKREVVYVKDNNEWHNDSKKNEKDGEVPNQKLKKAIKRITSKNMKMIPEWRDKYPDCVYAESRKSTLYNNMYYHTVDSSEEHSDKIIKNIAKEMVIQK